MTERDRGAPARVLDLRGLRCPLPVLKVRKALGMLLPGETLVALADDPLATLDIPNAARETGDETLAVEPRERGVRFVLRRGCGG